MPEKRDNEYYPHKLTESEVERAKNIDTGPEWEFSHIVESGFVMFVNWGTPFEEASIGPMDSGEVRAYVGEEVEQDEYVTRKKFEGDFETALEKLSEWIG